MLLLASSAAKKNVFGFTVAKYGDQQEEEATSQYSSVKYGSDHKMETEGLCLRIPWTVTKQGCGDPKIV